MKSTFFTIIPRHGGIGNLGFIAATGFTLPADRFWGISASSDGIRPFTYEIIEIGPQEKKNMNSNDIWFASNLYISFIFKMEPGLWLCSSDVQSDLNKIEELWWCLTDSIINNVFYYCEETICAVQKLITCLETIPAAAVERLCLSK